MANMSIEELIEEIEVYVDNCKTAGVLSSGSMIKINREELLAMLDEVRTRLPKELAESRQIIKSKESIIADAKARAERIVKDAAKEAGVMIDDNEIVAEWKGERNCKRGTDRRSAVYTEYVRRP